MSQSTVSAFNPACRAAETLSHALDRVLAQTVRQHEVIIVESSRLPIREPRRCALRNENRRFTISVAESDELPDMSPDKGVRDSARLPVGRLV